MKFVANTADAGAETLIADHRGFGRAILPFVTKAARATAQARARARAIFGAVSRGIKDATVNLGGSSFRWRNTIVRQCRWPEVCSKGTPPEQGDHFIVIRFTIVRTGCRAFRVSRTNLWNSLTWPRYGTTIRSLRERKGDRKFPWLRENLLSYSPPPPPSIIPLPLLPLPATRKIKVLGRGCEGEWNGYTKDIRKQGKRGHVRKLFRILVMKFFSV